MLLHRGDAIQHGPLKVLLHHRAERAGQAGIHRDRKVQRDDLALFDQLGERRQRHAVRPSAIAVGIVALLRRAEGVLHAGLSSNSDRNTQMPSTMDVRSFGSMRIQSSSNHRLTASNWARFRSGSRRWRIRPRR